MLQEGAQFLEGEELEKTRGQTAIAREEEDEEDDSDISKLKRTSTVVQTTEVHVTKCSMIIYVIQC